MASKHPNHDLSEMRCPQRLEDVDLFAPGGQEHWYEAYALLHSHAPVHRIEGGGVKPGTDAYILSKHEDVAAVVRDEARFPPLASLRINQILAEGIDVATNPTVNAMMASISTLRPNPAMWRAHRQELTDPWVGPGSHRHADMILQVANSLIDRWESSAPIDFISEFAQPLPHTVMAKVLGWPTADLALLKRFGDATVVPFVFGRGHLHVIDEAQTQAQLAELEVFRVYTQELIAEKRSNPADDMISFLCEVTYSPLNRKLTDLEINGVVYAMVIGGLETTQYALGEQMQLLCEQPQVWEQLKQDPGKIRAFTEEGMRLRSPTQGLSTRITSQEEVFQGVKIPAGSVLHMRWAAANIDPDEWDNPLELKLDRKAGTRHLAFSQGPRVCPGATLSRLEQTIAWSQLLDRFEGFSFAENNTFVHQPGIMLGVLELNINASPA